jgi:hypothetical protein
MAWLDGWQAEAWQGEGVGMTPSLCAPVNFTVPVEIGLDHQIHFFSFF